MRTAFQICILIVTALATIAMVIVAIRNLKEVHGRIQDEKKDLDY